MAGSKGKGSTCRFISALLSAAGFRTGLYLSPHLVDHRERFTLDGAFFPDEVYLSVAERLSQRLEGFTLPSGLGYGKASTFELYTAYAYLLFKEAGCQWAVIETGLGGRLDATNTLESTASVLTAIELEHTAILGDTIEKIAREKSKIIKSSQPVFTGFLPPEAMSVIKAEAESKAACIHSLQKLLLHFETRTTMEGEECSFTFNDGGKYKLCLQMRGEVQARNAALAILTVHTLGIPVHPEAIEKATLPGRFELVRHKACSIVLDVCHTKESMRHTVSSFAALFPEREKRSCIFAAIEGKDISQMLEILVHSFSLIVISRPSQAKRSDDEAIYREALAKADGKCTVLHITDTGEALEAAERGMEASLIAGSFYLTTLFEELINAEQQ